MNTPLHDSSHPDLSTAQAWLCLAWPLPLADFGLESRNASEPGQAPPVRSKGRRGTGRPGRDGRGALRISDERTGMDGPGADAVHGAAGQPGGLAQWIGFDGEGGRLDRTYLHRRHLTDSDLIIGRGGEATWSFPSDDQLSRLHARLFVADGKAWVEDLHSTNGTFLNGVSVTGPRAIEPGDVVRCGRQIFVLCLFDGLPSGGWDAARRLGLVGRYYGPGLLEQAAEAAASGAHILVSGESGTGKELLVGAIAQIAGVINGGSSHKEGLGSPYDDRMRSPHVDRARSPHEDRVRSPHDEGGKSRHEDGRKSRHDEGRKSQQEEGVRSWDMGGAISLQNQGESADRRLSSRMRDGSGAKGHAASSLGSESEYEWSGSPGSPGSPASPASPSLSASRRQGRRAHGSRRRRKGIKLISQNCAAFANEEEARSTLFGVLSGVFSGVGARKGLIEEAEGGILHLDEVHELSIGVQRSLLRFVEDGIHRRVGDVGPGRKVALRLVCTVNIPVGDAIEKGMIAFDLVNRLQQVCVPGLEERRPDIPEIFLYQLADAARGMGIDMGLVQGELKTWHMEAVTSAGYRQDNVRKLIRIANAVCAKLVLGWSAGHALDSVLGSMERNNPVVARKLREKTWAQDDGAEADRKNGRRSVYEEHKPVILAVYRACDGNLSKSVRKLSERGIRVSRRWLAVYLKKWGERR